MEITAYRFYIHGIYDPLFLDYRCLIMSREE